MPTRSFASSLLAMFAATLVAQQPQPAEGAAPKRVTVPPGEQPVVQLVQVVARLAKHNILCDEQQVVGVKPIALTEPVTLEPATCEDVLCSLLRTRGLAMVPVDTERGIYEVLAIAGPRGREIMAAALTRTPEQILAQPESRRVVVTTCKLEHVTAPFMTNMLRPMFAASNGPDFQLGVAPQGLILRGCQNEVASALKIIQDNDKPLTAPGGPPRAPAAAPVATPVAAPELAARVAALEKQVEELKKTIAALQQGAGK